MGIDSGNAGQVLIRFAGKGTMQPLDYPQIPLYRSLAWALLDFIQAGSDCLIMGSSYRPNSDWEVH